MLCRFLSILAANAAVLCPAALAQNAVSVDFNGDCAVDSLDAFEFLRLYNNDNMLAELTGDGLIDTDDVLAFSDAAQFDPGPFDIHWCVTTQFGETPRDIGYRMDGAFGEDPNHPDIDKSALPLAEDACIVYDRSCGYYPREGLHALFLRFDDPTRWRESYLDWRAAHWAQINTLVPRILASHDPPYTYGVIDYESWHLRWVDMRTNQPRSEEVDAICRNWTGVVDAINSPEWDPEFFNNTGFTPPPGSDGIDDLSDEDREPAYRLAWDRFARRLYLHTLNACRAADDDTGHVKWSFWRYPQVHWDRPANDRDRERNDDLAWLYRQCEVLSPRFYRRRYTAEYENDPGPCDDDQKVRTHQDQAIDWTSSMQEILRVRDLYAPDAEVIPFVWWHYQLGKDCGYPFLNGTDTMEAIRILRRWGADGIYIWGYMNPYPGNEEIAEPATREEIEAELELHWRDALWNAYCPKP